MEGRDENGRFKKGERPVGRTIGTQNKMTVEHKNRIKAFFERHWGEFEDEIWPQLTPKEKRDTIISLMNYEYPRLSNIDVKSDNKVESSVLESIREKIRSSSII